MYLFRDKQQRKIKKIQRCYIWPMVGWTRAAFRSSCFFEAKCHYRFCLPSPDVWAVKWGNIHSHWKSGIWKCNKIVMWSHLHKFWFNLYFHSSSSVIVLWVSLLKSLARMPLTDYYFHDRNRENSITEVLLQCYIYLSYISVYKPFYSIEHIFLDMYVPKQLNQVW